VIDKSRIASRKIRRAARDQACTLNIVGICNYDTDTTVFAHLPDESHGMAIKSTDASGCFACSSCHDVVDGKRYWQEFDEHKDFYLFRAFKRTLGKLFELGVLVIA